MQLNKLLYSCARMVLCWFQCVLLSQTHVICCCSAVHTTLVVEIGIKNRHFSSWTWVSQYRNVSILDFIEAKDDESGGDNWCYKMCKALAKSSPPTNAQFIYRPDALSVVQPTVSKH